MFYFGALFPFDSVAYELVSGVELVITLEMLVELVVV